MIIRPCARCYRARNFVKDGLGRLIPRQSTHVSYTTNYGQIRVKIGTNIIDKADYANFIGLEVYAGREKLIDVATQHKIADIYRWQRVKVAI